MDIDGLPVETFIDDYQNDDNEHSKVAASKIKKRTKVRIIRCVWFNNKVEPEKHYRELIMLFTTWRNKEIDLLG